MVEKVVWRLRAQRSFNKIIIYLKSEWSIEIADAFIEKSRLKVEGIKKFPELGSISKKNYKYRRILITKHNALIYRVKDKHCL